MTDDADPEQLPPIPRPAVRQHATRRDTGSVWVGNAIFLLGALFGMGLMLLLSRMFPTREDADLEHFKEVRRFLLDTHVAELDREELMRDAIRGMFEGLAEDPGDAYSNYYAKEEAEAVDRDTSGHFLGIGVVFRGQSDQAQVLFPVADGPAERAGLRVGDVLLSIGGSSLEGLSPSAASSLLRGELGDVLDVEVLGRDGLRRHHELVLSQLTDPSVRHADLLDEERGIGYIAVLGFSNETTRQFDQAFEELQRRGMRALILDLRGNRGGVLSAAVEIAQRFIHEGRITSTEGRGEPEYELARPELAKYVGLPLVVLVDRYSASASEVLAGALQDHRAAVLVGEPTYGKGMVQTISRYPQHSAIAKVTSSFYYTPAHRNLEAHYGHGARVGLSPDVHIPISDEERNELESYLHNTFSPPPVALAELRAWEKQSGEVLLPSHPHDRPLSAALGLFTGVNASTMARVEEDQ